MQTNPRLYLVVLIPYRARIVEEKQLSNKQKLLIKLDLHYSHKTDALKKLCDESTMVLLYVPYKFTDFLQELEVIHNASFKAISLKPFYSSDK